MSQVFQSDSLSWGDAFFLYLEREGQPLNIAGVLEFEGRIPLEKCIAFVESRLPLIPRYTQRVVVPPFNVGLPSWQPDPRFAIRNHIREVRFNRGTDVDLKALTAELVSSRMNREHPLWDFTLVHGLKDNRTAIIVRLHHCLADGIAGVGIMNVLMDASPTPPKTKAPKAPAAAAPNRDPGAVLLDSLLKSYLGILEGAFTAHSEVMNIARDLVAGAGSGSLAEMIRLVPELATPAERLPFNQVCRGPQKVAWAEFAMSDIKAIRTECGGTVNDVLLTIVTAAFRRYSELHGARLRGRQLRVIVPVNIRGNGDATNLGNRITFLPVNLPLDVRDPRKLLARVSERMTFLRSAGVADFVGLAGGFISQIPLPLQALLAPIASQLPLSLCNTICTNVPGPQVPLYFVGHKMVRWYPYVPIGGEMGINVAILSYNGTAYFGFSGDSYAAPDLERLENITAVCIDQLKKAAGVPSSGAMAKNAPTAAATRSRAARKPEPSAVPRGKTDSRLTRTDFVPKKQAKRRVVKATPATVVRQTAAVASQAEPEPELAMVGD